MGRQPVYSTLTSCARIGVGDLHRHGILRTGYESTWPFTSRDGPFTVTVTVDEYTVTFASGAVKTRVELVRVPMPYGGTRPWFLCPHCRRRRGMMFLGTNTWACRVCFRLKYPSSREDRHGRLGTKLAKTMRKLGAKYGDKPLFVPKPKWQRWPTYERLVAEAREIDHAMAVELLGMFGSRFGGVDNLIRRSLGK